MANILQSKTLRKVALVAAGLLVVAIVAIGTMVLLSRITPSQQTKEPVSQEVVIQQMELGRKNVISATEKASKGETDAAIALYKEAVTHFQNAGDKSSEDAVQLEIEYLEKVKTMSKNTGSSTQTVPITPTPVDPTDAPGYGVTATYPE